MKNKITVILLSVILCLCMALPVFAAGAADERVIDGAGLLSDSQKAALNDKIAEIRERQKMDIVIMTIKSLDGSTSRDYADDAFDYNGYGYGANRDGLLLLISMDDRAWYISTHGYGITAFTDAGIQYIGDKIKGDLADKNYAEAFDTFAELCDKFITQAREGNPYDVSNMPKEPLSLMLIPISIVIGLILALITVGKMKSKLKTVRFQAAAGSYMKDNSLNITQSRDLFLYNIVSRTEKPKSNSSSGGSSSHTSSSGSTHGGGGGSF